MQAYPMRQGALRGVTGRHTVAYRRQSCSTASSCARSGERDVPVDDDVDEGCRRARRRRAAVARPARRPRGARRDRGSSRAPADSSRRRRGPPLRRAPGATAVAEPRLGGGEEPDRRRSRAEPLGEHRADRRGSRRSRARRSNRRPRARRRRRPPRSSGASRSTSTSTRRGSGPSAAAIATPSRPAVCFLRSTRTWYPAESSSGTITIGCSPGRASRDAATSGCCTSTCPSRTVTSGSRSATARRAPDRRPGPGRSVPCEIARRAGFVIPSIRRRPPPVVVATGATVASASPDAPHAAGDRSRTQARVVGGCALGRTWCQAAGAAVLPARRGGGPAPRPKPAVEAALVGASRRRGDRA